MDLVKFLVKAKKNTYASVGEGGEKIRLEDGSKELIYKEGDLIYRDRYFGLLYFIGEEVVFEKNVSIWGMNYYGQTFDPEMTNVMVAGFLQKALRAVTEDLPYRGPKEFIEGDWKYTNQASGNIENFVGHEEIFYKIKRVYKLDYHGGFIKK